MTTDKKELYFEDHDELIVTESQINAETDYHKLSEWYKQLQTAKGSTDARLERAKAQQLNKEHICPDWFGKLYAKDKILGNLMQQICERKHDLKATYNQTTEKLFMDSARDLLPRETFKEIWEETKKRRQSQTEVSDGILTMSNEAQVN